MRFQIHHHETVSSTNDLLKAMTGAPEFTVIVADEQTAGRGRRSRSWHSSAGDGLYLSLLLCPRNEKARLSLLSLAAAISVAETIREIPVRGVDIKWPNDLLLRGRKWCGILSEMQADRDDIHYVVVGIGINVNHCDFPEELGQRATSLRIEGKQTYSRVAVLCEFLLRFELLYDDLQRGSHATVLQRWVDRSSFAFGKQVMVDLGNGKKLEGHTTGLSELGNLKVKLADGHVEEVMSGDIVAWR